jgi:iron complex outermembrane receptor protein
MGNAADCYIKVENLFDESLQSHFGYPDDGLRFAAALHVRF